MRMRHIVICGLPGFKYFSTLSHKRYDFRRKIELIVCILIFSKTFAWNVSNSKKNSARYDQKFVLVFI